MQKQWFLFGSAASMAFVLVILGGVFGNSLAQKNLGDLATLPTTQSQALEPTLANSSTGEQGSTVNSVGYRSSNDRQRFPLEEHTEARDDD
jgi:hypothetical protein